MSIDNKAARNAGDYTVNKLFSVTKPNTKAENINGIVVQKVTKNTNATVKSGQALNTTANIKTFTSGKVDFACDSYLEYFIIRRGVLYPSNITDGFAGGAIAKYEYDKSTRTYDAIFDDKDPNYITSGSIIHMGDNVFISDSEMGPIIALPWITGAAAKKLPSNGLPYLDLSHWATILGKKQSNILTHRVDVSWVNSGKSKITSTSTSTAGGKRSSSSSSRKRSSSKRQQSSSRSRRRSRTMKL